MEDEFVEVQRPIACTAPEWARLEYIKGELEEEAEVVVVRGSVQPWVRLEYMREKSTEEEEVDAVVVPATALTRGERP